MSKGIEAFQQRKWNTGDADEEDPKANRRPSDSTGSFPKYKATRG